MTHVSNADMSDVSLAAQFGTQPLKTLCMSSDLLDLCFKIF